MQFHPTVRLHHWASKKGRTKKSFTVDIHTQYICNALILRVTFILLILYV